MFQDSQKMVFSHNRKKKRERETQNNIDMDLPSLCQIIFFFHMIWALPVSLAFPLSCPDLLPVLISFLVATPLNCSRCLTIPCSFSLALSSNSFLYLKSFYHILLMWNLFLYFNIKLRYKFILEFLLDLSCQIQTGKNCHSRVLPRYD